MSGTNEACIEMDVERFHFPAFRTTSESLESLEKEIGNPTYVFKDAVLVFEMKVKESLMLNEIGKVRFLSKHIQSKWIFVSFQSTFDQKCIIYWKTKEQKEFLILKLMDDQVENFIEMVKEFLIQQLKKGQQGVLPLYDGLDGKEIALHIIADIEGFNLLMKASQEGQVEIVKQLLKEQVDVSYKVNDKYAVDLAWERKHYDVVLELLKANSKFPSAKSIEDSPSVDIDNFIQVCTGMHKAIDDKDLEKIKNFAKDNPHLRHFFNIRNRSALHVTIGKGEGHIEIYELLFSLNIFLGPDERAIYNKMPRKRVQHINNKFSRDSPDPHLLTLISNSRLFIDNIDVDTCYKSIREAYEILNSISQIKPILQVVAASQNFNIFFDLNRESVKLMDPVTTVSANGMFYPEGRLYLAFKDFLHSNTKFNAIGVLAHELCHFAMHLVFRNDRKPYAINDTEIESKFEVISQLCRDRMEDENIIKLVYGGTNYDNSKYHTELIVRVPHILANYHENREKTEVCQTKFVELFQFFQTKTLPVIVKTIPVMEMISNDQIRFDSLTAELQAKVLHATVICGKKRITLDDARRFDQYILPKLQSSQICDILNGQVIEVKIEIYVDRKFIDRNIEDPYKKEWLKKKFDYIHLDKIKSLDDIVSGSRRSERNKETIFLLSDMPGAGKTTCFKQFVMEIKEKYPEFWVFYIDLKQHIDIYKKYVKDEQEVENIIFQILHFPNDDETSKFLKDFQNSRNLFFLWDGFDEISESPDYKTFTLNFLRKIKLLGHQQWISTRPQYVTDLETAFSTTAYKLVTFTKDNQKESLEMFFELKGLASMEIREKIDSLQTFFDKLDTNADYRSFNNPLLLFIAAENSLHENLQDCNVYTTYENFIFEKVKKLREKGDLIESIRDKAIVDGVNVMRVHQKAAVDTIFIFSKREYLGKTIKVSQLKVLGQDDSMSKNRTSVYGISFVQHNKLVFVHRTFAEFFVAQFLIKKIFNLKDDESDEWDDDYLEVDEYFDDFEATQIIFLLFTILSDEIIFNFIFSFINRNSEKIRVKNSIRRTLECLTSHEQNIFKYDFSHFRFIMRNFTKLFSFDHDILRRFWALHLNENLFVLAMKGQIHGLIYVFNEMFEFVNVKFVKSVQKKISYRYCCDQMDSSSFRHIFSDCDHSVNVDPSNQRQFKMAGLINHMDLSWIESENQIKVYCKFQVEILKEIILILKQIPGVTEELLAGKNQRGSNLFEFWFHFRGIWSSLYVDNMQQFPGIMQILFNFVRTEIDANIFAEILARDKFTQFLELIPNELEVSEIFFRNFTKILQCSIKSNAIEIEQIWCEFKKNFNDENFLLQIILCWQHRFCSKICFRDNRGFELLYDDVKLIAFELSRRNFEYDCLKEFQSKFDEITTNKVNFLKILLLDEDTSFDKNHDYLLHVTNLKWEIYLTLLKEFEKYICKSRQMKKYFYEKTLEFSCKYVVEDVFFHVLGESQNEKLFSNRELIEFFTFGNLEQFITYSSLTACIKIAKIMAEIFRNKKDRLEAMLIRNHFPDYSIISITINDPEKLKLFREILLYAVRENDRDEFPLEPITDEEFLEICSEISVVLANLEEFRTTGGEALFSFIELANLYFTGKSLQTLTLFAFTSKFGEHCDFDDYANSSNIPFNHILESHFNKTSISHQDDELEILEKLKICAENIRETFFDILIANFVIQLINNIEDDVPDRSDAHNWASHFRKFISTYTNHSDSYEKEIKFLIFISNDDNCSNIRKLLMYVVRGGSFKAFNKKKISSRILTKFPHNFPSTFFFVMLLGSENFEIVNRAWKINKFENLSAWFAGNYADIFTENSGKMIECEELLRNVYDYEFSGGKLLEHKHFFKAIGERKKDDFKKLYKENRKRL